MAVTAIIKAIETSYKGYRFRSRLEARWAVFFDALGVKWEYEKEGYDLGKYSGWYLPDFWLPQVSMWAEVKPATFTMHEKLKCMFLSSKTGNDCLLLDGLPGEKTYDSAKGAEFAITAYHFHNGEHRFYSAPPHNDFDDTITAALAAKAARFES